MVIDIRSFLSENPAISKVVFNQTWGLGDIMYIERIYRYFHDLGLGVIAPVQDQYLWIGEHIPYVDFRMASQFQMDYERFDFGIHFSEGVAHADTLYMPTRFSDQIYRDLRPHDPSASRYWMTDKYRVLGLDPSDWLGIELRRVPEREQELKRLVLSNIDGDYDFCNLNYHNLNNLRIDPSSIRSSGLPMVEMAKVDGFTMVDWCGIIEGAKSVHTVSTSVLYMVQAIYDPGKDYHIYPRPPENGFYTVEDFLPDYWIKHYT